MLRWWSKSKWKQSSFKVGDCVSVKIPRIDCTGAAFGRLPGMVCKISNHKQHFYGIVTEYGMLNDNYLASDLESYSGVVNVTLEKYKPISLKPLDFKVYLPVRQKK